jgi:DNA mismatch endonuclease (patch repair protein)
MRRVDTRGVARRFGDEPVGDRLVSLGGGLRVPYPEPTSDAATKIGRANVRTGTRPEVSLRAALHRRGLRFRKDFPIRIDGGRPIRPDIVFSRAKIAVFVDGCFWHGCPIHQHIPRSNPDYWIPKLERNSRRDREVVHALAEGGWRAVRIWEHDVADVEIVDEIERLVRSDDLPRSK